MERIKITNDKDSLRRTGGQAYADEHAGKIHDAVIQDSGWAATGTNTFKPGDFTRLDYVPKKAFVYQTENSQWANVWTEETAHYKRSSKKDRKHGNAFLISAWHEDEDELDNAPVEAVLPHTTPKSVVEGVVKLLGYDEIEWALDERFEFSE